MEKTITIKDTVGLHALLASKIVQTAQLYDASVRLEYKDKVVDAKSILGLVSLAVPHGQDVVLVVDGVDAEKAFNKIQKLLG